MVGIKYQWDDGIFSITLGNRQPDGYRIVYFHAMARWAQFTQFVLFNLVLITIHLHLIEIQFI